LRLTIAGAKARGVHANARQPIAQTARGAVASAHGEVFKIVVFIVEDDVSMSEALEAVILTAGRFVVAFMSAASFLP
jgi:hypothetical protein